MKIKLQILIVLSALFFTAGFAHADCITATMDSNQQGATIVGNCPTSTRLIGVPADNNVFYSDCIQQWYLGTDFTWSWNPLPVCGGWHGGAGQTFWFFMPQGQSYDCHDLASCEMSASYGYVLLQRIGGVWSIIPTSPTVAITTPANNSTITDSSTQINGTYAALNQGLSGYGYLHIWLYNPITQTRSASKSLLLSSSSGSFQFPVSDFALTSNGNWQVQADQEWDANTFVDLTPSPAINFNFSISGNSASSDFTITSDGTFSQTDIGGGSLCYYSFSTSVPHSCSNSNTWAAHNCNSPVNLDCPVGSYMQGAMCGTTTSDNEILICNYGTNGFGGTPPFSYAVYKYSSYWTTAPLPTSPTLTVSAPNNGATITANTTTVSGSYAALNAGDYGYGYLKIWLQNPNNNISSHVYTIPLSSGIGTFSTPLSTFGITENGTWNLKAQQELDANTFQDLTPSPTYALNVNIAGNSAPYNFTDWNTWYTQNAAGGYSAPSDFANSIEGFFQPIFTNVYEFANQTLAYFNATTAYDKGNQIGLVFPTTQAYLNKINIFFGGFPLVPFFEFLIVVMLGIFIVRTIFKFIPFFG